MLILHFFSSNLNCGIRCDHVNTNDVLVLIILRSIWNHLEIEITDNWSPADQVTLRQRSGHSGVCVLLRVGKDGKWGHDHACPLPTGHCAVGPCGKRACATTLLPVQANMVSQDQVRLPNSVLFLYCKNDDQSFIIYVICLILCSWGRGDRSCTVFVTLNSAGSQPLHCHVEVKYSK